MSEMAGSSDAAGPVSGTSPEQDIPLGERRGNALRMSEGRGVLLFDGPMNAIGPAVADIEVGRLDVNVWNRFGAPVERMIADENPKLDYWIETYRPAGYWVTQLIGHRWTTVNWTHVLSSHLVRVLCRKACRLLKTHGILLASGASSPWCVYEVFSPAGKSIERYELGDAHIVGFEFGRADDLGFLTDYYDVVVSEPWDIAAAPDTPIQSCRYAFRSESRQASKKQISDVRFLDELLAARDAYAPADEELPNWPLVVHPHLYERIDFVHAWDT